MKVLIAIITCHAFRGRADAQRATWVKDIEDADIKFFLGHRPGYVPLADEVMLDCPDDYHHLIKKIQEMRKWAYDQGYDWVAKLDDDVYCRPERLMKSLPTQKDVHYVGRKRGPSGPYPAPYASGFFYWMSRHALQTIKDINWATDKSNDWAEDRWTGNQLLKHGIVCTLDTRHLIIDSRKNFVYGVEGPRKGNQIITAGEFSPEIMHRAHREFLTVPSKFRTEPLTESPFSKMCILIKTFLRDGYLEQCLKGINQTLPGAKIVVVDDGYEASAKIGWYSRLREYGHVAEWLPFDLGFGAKANEGIKHCDRDYVLIGSDDFDFTVEAMDGIAKMIWILDHDKDLHLISGRVNNKAYHAKLTIKGTDCYEEAGHREVRTMKELTYLVTDLTVNYSLIRREVFEKVSWDEDIKIGGGEHGAFFIDLMRAGFKCAVLPEANINEQKGLSTWQHPTYGNMRARARMPGRPCLKRRGIERFFLMGGGCEQS